MLHFNCIRAILDGQELLDFLDQKDLKVTMVLQVLQVHLELMEQEFVANY